MQKLNATLAMSFRGLVGVACLLTIVLYKAQLIATPKQNGSEPGISREVAPVDNSLSSSGVNLKAGGSEYPKWTTMKHVNVTMAAEAGAILLSVMPQTHALGVADTPFAIRLFNPKAGINNHWQIRYMRDSSFQVAAFSISALSVSDEAEYCWPLNLSAIDTPSIGLHSYTLQIRYVGDRVDGEFGHLEMLGGRLIAMSQ
ncbi:MAG: hypothetical protein WBM24_20670 [Candidatus Sulfotelmatobacter sp.]